MKRFRYAIRQFHRWSGLLVAIPFVVISITGAGLQKKFQVWKNPVMNLKGENFQEVIRNVKLRIEQIQKSLPEGGILGR